MPLSLRLARELVDDHLDSRWPDDDGISGAIRYSVLSPGKRIRPALMFAGAMCCGGSEEHLRRITPVAAAIEMLHTYSLVHDDLPAMDDDDLRRGRATSHKVYGDGVAILVGDALLTECFTSIAAIRGVCSPESLLQIIQTLGDAAGSRGMVGGQYLDLLGSGASDVRKIHDLKTGCLLSASVAIGAISVEAPASVVEGCARFGSEVGWLFQLVDDLLDVTGNPDQTGKMTGTDQRLARRTAVLDLGVEGVVAEADAQLVRCLEIAESLPGGGGDLPVLAKLIRDRNN